MKKIIMTYLLALGLCAVQAQKPSADSLKLPEDAEGAFFATSSRVKIQPALKIEDIDIDFADDKPDKYYALFIGIQDYKDARMLPLSHPAFDAQKFQEILVENYTFEKVDTRFLKNPTRSQLLKTFDSLALKLSSKDNLLIFYAGHGYWDGLTETGYWLPADAKKDDKGNWYSNQELLDAIKKIKTKHTLVITDACFGGSIFKTARKGIEEAEDIVIQELYKKPSRRAITSGSLREVPDQSIFIQTLFRFLLNNPNHYMPAIDLFVAIKNPIIRESQNSTVPQLPQYGELNISAHLGGDFIFIKREKIKTKRK
ncbi:MAG: caspase family protein [Microscillaceae bacterium]|nr:caspase family protein [Microscillaceae bacterium]